MGREKRVRCKNLFGVMNWLSYFEEDPSTRNYVFKHELDHLMVAAELGYNPTFVCYSVEDKWGKIEMDFGDNIPSPREMTEIAMSPEKPSKDDYDEALTNGGDYAVYKKMCEQIGEPGKC